ncbi:hypothetical protein [Microbacterium sp. CJ88]|uniref:hypothetical protein n=1 Tax=Microbacterium sp. CJ88 TaxID=3445672 RepID=UPI003F658687
MNIADTLRGLLRRWYIVFPGIIVAMATALGTFAAVPPGYERTATQLLLPGTGTVPPGVTNPFLYLGGLTQAADIVVAVMKSGEVAGVVASEYPGTDVVVQRNPTVSGPVIQIIVTARSDADAGAALDALVNETSTVLDRLQTEQNVTADDLMTVSTLTQDQQSTLQQKNRLLLSAGVGIGLVLLTLIIASLVDGLARRGRRTGRQGSSLPSSPIADDPNDDGAVEEPQADAEEADAERTDVVPVADLEPDDTVAIDIVPAAEPVVDAETQPEVPSADEPTASTPPGGGHGRGRRAPLARRR